jgi:hypothetical protein
MPTNIFHGNWLVSLADNRLRQSVVPRELSGCCIILNARQQAQLASELIPPTKIKKIS